MIRRLLLLVATASVLGSGASATASDDAGRCVAVWPEARYGAMGYNHIVHLRNACTRDAECAVTTNVNPQPVAAIVPARREVTVTTWLGSPAREFTPHADCHFQ